MTVKQPGHRLWVNNKEARANPPDLDKEQPDKIIDLTVKEETIDIPPPPGLALPIPMDVDNPIPHPEDAAPPPDLPIPGGDAIVDLDKDKPTEAYKPTHRMTGKQSPPHQVHAIVAQLDDIEKTKEIRLENNEDKGEKRQMESIMSDVQ
eukprot:2639991-Amphidinium_carterae.1